MLDLLEREGEDGVGSGGCVVHLGAGGCTVQVSNLHETLDILVAAHRLIGQVLHVYTIALGFADLEVIGRSALGREEVLDVLVVDFEVGDVNLVRYSTVLLRVYSFKQASASSRDETRLIRRAHHRVRLAAAGLAVGEDARVVSVEVVIQEVLTEGAVDIGLARKVWVCFIVRPEGLIECE